MEKPPVPPEGDLYSGVVFVARNPGIEEFQAEPKRPLIGRGGRLFNSCLLKMGWRREKIFIHNTCLCHTIKDRQPSYEEMINCRSFLKFIVKLVNPKIIVTMGRHSTENTLDLINRWDGDLSIYRAMPGSFLSYRNVPVQAKDICVYPIIHPGQALRIGFSNMEEDFECLSKFVHNFFPDIYRYVTEPSQ